MRRAAALLLILLAASCGGAPEPVPGGPIAAPAPPPQAPGTRQRAWGGRIGRVSLLFIVGEAYAARVRKHVPLQAAVLRVTNGEKGMLRLDREHDEVVLRTHAGTQLPRTDIWSRADWLLPLASMPPEDRSRFRYPDVVLPEAAVDVTITFEGSPALDELKDVWVRIASLPAEGTWLAPIEREAPGTLP